MPEEFKSVCLIQSGDTSSLCFDVFFFLLNASLAVTLLMGIVIGACLQHVWHARRAAHPPAERGGESGSVFLTLFMAVGLLGALGMGVSMLIRGPVSSMANVTRHTTVENDLIAATSLLSAASLAAPLADCDADGYIEPVAFAAPSGGAFPAGGGYIPAGIGASKTDPWRTAYGYCLWDNGNKLQDTGCGGVATGRRKGKDAQTLAAIAVISAGPDKTFQTSCLDWTSDAVPVINKPSGSDDIVRIVPYGQFMLPSGGSSQLKELPDAACTPQSIGLMRLMLGAVQVCTETGWTEVGASTQADGSFADVTNAELGSAQTSNAISFSGFAGTKTLTVEGGATLKINGVTKTSPATIKAGDTIALSGAADALPGTTKTYAIVVSGVRKVWNITTRAPYPANLTITPSAATMNVTGPGSPAYGTPVSFVVKNTGELDAGPLLSASLSTVANYGLYIGGAYQGDGCVGKTLAGGAQCAVAVRSRSSGESIPSATLTVTAGSSSVTAVASMMGAVNGWAVDCVAMGAMQVRDKVCAYTTAGVSTLSLDPDQAIVIQAWGAGGAAGSVQNDYTDGDGGGGGYSEGRFVNGSSSLSLKIVVGQGGTGGLNNGGGGGHSGVFKNTETHANALLIAGGGGHGGSNNNYDHTSQDTAGGAGGGSIGQDGKGGSGGGGPGGGGGTQSAGGISAFSGALNGSALLGGDAYASGSYARWGGSGYYGGGGGRGYNSGSGGGSGYLASGITSGVTITGNYRTPAGQGKPYYGGNAGLGGLGVNQNNNPVSDGKNGLVVITFE